MAENAFKADWPSFALGFNTGKSKGGGGVELNIAYGDTPPEDTSKLWVKTSEPSGVLISPKVETTEMDSMSLTALPEPLPTALAYAGIGAVGSKIYIIGGYAPSGTSNKKSSSVIIYDIETQTFEVLEGVLETGIGNIQGAVVGTRIYFFGNDADGSASSALIRYFDTETRKLITCEAQMPTAGYGFTCASMDDEIYVFGGRSGSNTFTTIYKFDTKTEVLTPIAEGITNANASCARVGNIFFLIGDSLATDNYEFDCVALTMSKTSKVSGGIGARVVRVGDFICTVGSRTGKSVSLRDIQTYTSVSTGCRLPDSCAWSAIEAVGNKVYIFGGSNGNTSTNPLDFAYVFSLTVDVPALDEGAIYVKPKVQGDTWSLLNGDRLAVEIGVDSVYKGNADGIGEKVEAALYKDGEWVTI